MFTIKRQRFRDWHQWPKGRQHFLEVEACCFRIDGLLQIDNLGFKRIIEKESRSWLMVRERERQKLIPESNTLAVYTIQLLIIINKMSRSAPRISGFYAHHFTNGQSSIYNHPSKIHVILVPHPENESSMIKNGRPFLPFLFSNEPIFEGFVIEDYCHVSVNGNAYTIQALMDRLRYKFGEVNWDFIWQVSSWSYDPQGNPVFGDDLQTIQLKDINILELAMQLDPQGGDTRRLAIRFRGIKPPNHEGE